jgi:SAM-dependent methyltransferase
MTDGVNDYGPVAWLYDRYVQVEFDLPFFREEAAHATGPVLELTAGTGRVSGCLLETGANLTCVDVSRDMLHVLTRKFSRVSHAPLTVCADIRHLPLRDCYRLLVIPFNSFLEVTDERDQLLALSEARSALVRGGRIICTLHNPTVRRRSFGSKPRLLGRFELPESGGHVEIWVREKWRQETRVAEAEQSYRLYDNSGSLEREHTMYVRFALIEQPAFNAMVQDAGLEVIELFGDYDRSSFHAESSPYMIWILRRP